MSGGVSQASGGATVGADVAQLRTAVAADLDLLALLHDTEPGPACVGELKACPFASYLGIRPSGEAARRATTALDAAISALPAPDDAHGLDELAAGFADVYLRHTYRAAPSESVWLDPDGLERQGPMFQVRGWYRRYGFAWQDTARRPDDHLVAQLRFLAWGLADPHRMPLDEVAQYLDEHLLLWILDFAGRLREMGAPPFYVALAAVTATYLDELRTHLEVITGRARPVPSEPAAPTPTKAAERVQVRYVPGTAPSW